MGNCPHKSNRHERDPQFYISLQGTKAENGQHSIFDEVALAFIMLPCIAYVSAFKILNWLN